MKKPDAFKDDCLMDALHRPRRGHRHAFCKIGTMSLECVLLSREPVLGEAIKFRHLFSRSKWENARVWKIDGELVFLELW